MQKRIEVCGGIAAGKTTLVSGLRETEFSPIYECFRDTQFYNAFYENPASYAFEAEIDFLLQHYHMIKRETHRSNLICDYSLWLDHAYANTNLSGKKHRAFSAVWKEALSDIGYPALIINLQCEPTIQKDRITRRDRSEEESITIEYLAKLNYQIEQEIVLLRDEVPILDIDVTRVDFTSTAPNGRPVLDRIGNTISHLLSNGHFGRHKF